MKNAERIIAIGFLITGIGFFAYLDYRLSRASNGSNLYGTQRKSEGLFAGKEKKTPEETRDKNFARKGILSREYFDLRNKITDVEKELTSLRDDINKLEERSYSEFENGGISNISKKSDAKVDVALPHFSESKKATLSHSDSGTVKMFPTLVSSGSSIFPKLKPKSKDTVDDLSNKNENIPGIKDTTAFNNTNRFKLSRRKLDDNSTETYKKNFPSSSLSTRDRVMNESFAKPRLSSERKVGDLSEIPKEDISKVVKDDDKPFGKTEKPMKKYEDIDKINNMVFGEMETKKPVVLSKSSESYSAISQPLEENSSSIPKSLNITEGKDKDEVLARPGKTGGIFNDPFMFSDMETGETNKVNTNDTSTALSPANLTKVFCESFNDPAVAFKQGKCIFKAKSNYHYAKSMGFLSQDALDKIHNGSLDSEDESKFKRVVVHHDDAYSKKLGGVVRIEKDDFHKAESSKNSESPFSTNHNSTEKPVSSTIHSHEMSKKTSDHDTSSTDKSGGERKPLSKSTNNYRDNKKDDSLDFDFSKDVKKEPGSGIKHENMMDDLMDISSIMGKYTMPSISGFVPKLADFVSKDPEAPVASGDDYSHEQRGILVPNKHSGEEVLENTVNEKALDNSKSSEHKITSKPVAEKITVAEKEVDSTKNVNKMHTKPNAPTHSKPFSLDSFKHAKIDNMDTESSSSSDYSSTASNYTSRTPLPTHPLDLSKPKPSPFSNEEPTAKPLSVGVIISSIKSDSKSGLVDKQSEKASMLSSKAQDSEKKKATKEENSD
ncbi:hypothetical protein PAEPH01_0244 [Pancytospora epiphaga]|nr:hypothetical protein PAEPH01_0244 [Pancytospora epiphaga]